MSEEPRRKAVPFDAEGLIWDYRDAHERGDKAKMLELRGRWKKLQGDDCLHASAFDDLKTFPPDVVGFDPTGAPPLPE